MREIRLSGSGEGAVLSRPYLISCEAYPRDWFTNSSTRSLLRRVFRILRSQTERGGVRPSSGGKR